MAVIDNFLLLSGSYSGATVTGQNVFASGASVVSTNSIDTRGGTVTGQNVDLGAGAPLYLNVTVTTAFAGGTSAAFEIISADDAALTTNVTPLASSGAIAIASLGAGKKVSVPMGNVDPRTIRRYIGYRCTNVGANSAGAVVANLSPFLGDRSSQQSYQNGFTVN